MKKAHINCSPKQNGNFEKEGEKMMNDRKAMLFQLRNKV